MGSVLSSFVPTFEVKHTVTAPELESLLESMKAQLAAFAGAASAATSEFSSMADDFVRDAGRTSKGAHLLVGCFISLFQCYRSPTMVDIAASVAQVVNLAIALKVRDLFGDALSYIGAAMKSMVRLFTVGSRPIRAESVGDYFDAICTFFASIVTRICSVTIDLSMVVKVALASFVGMNFKIPLWSQVFALFEHVIGAVMYYVFGVEFYPGVIAPLMVKVNDWVKRASLEHDRIRDQKGYSARDAGSIEALLKESTEFQNELTRGRAKDTYLMHFHKCVKLLVELQLDIKNKLVQNRTRPEPVLIYFSGPAGLYKSVAAQVLCNALARIHDIPKEKSTFTKPRESAYFDGYNYQAAWFIDDLFVVNDKESSRKDVELLLAAVNTAPMTLNMSGVEDKGRFVFDSPYVVVTSNVEGPYNGCLQDPIAFSRRIRLHITPVAIQAKGFVNPITDMTFIVKSVNSVGVVSAPREGFTLSFLEMVEFCYSARMSNVRIHNQSAEFPGMDDMIKTVRKDRDDKVVVPGDVEVRSEGLAGIIFGYATFTAAFTLMYKNLNTFGDNFDPVGNPTLHSVDADKLDPAEREFDKLIYILRFALYKAFDEQYFFKVVGDVYFLPIVIEGFKGRARSVELGLPEGGPENDTGDYEFATGQVYNLFGMDGTIVIKRGQGNSIAKNTFVSKRQLRALLARPARAERLVKIGEALKEWAELCWSMEVAKYRNYVLLYGVSAAFTMVAAVAFSWITSEPEKKEETPSLKTEDGKPPSWLTRLGHKQLLELRRRAKDFGNWQRVKAEEDGFSAQKVFEKEGRSVRSTINAGLNAEAGVADVFNAVERNVVSVRLEDGNKQALCHGVYIVNDIMVLPMHVLSAFMDDEHKVDASKIKLDVKFKEGYTEKGVPLLAYNIADGRDLFFVRAPLKGRKCASIYKHFVTDADLKKQMRPCLRVVKSGSPNTYYYALTTRVDGVDYVDGNGNGTVYTKDAFVVDGHDTDSSDCGSLYYDSLKTSVRRIMGIHVAGGTGRSYGVFVTTDIIDAVLGDEMKTESGNAIPELHNEYVNMVTGIQKSPIYDHVVKRFGEPKYRPVLPSRPPGKVVRAEMIGVAMSRLDYDRKAFTAEEYAFSRKCIGNLFGRRESNKPSIMTFDEAINGRPGDLGGYDVGRIFMRTSPGLPWKHLGGPGKSACFTRVGEGDEQKFVPCPELMWVMEASWEMLRTTGKCPGTAMFATKDETRPVGKVYRPIWPSSVDRVVIGRRLFGVFMGEMFKRSARGPICLAINVHGPEWGALAQRMTSERFKSWLELDVKSQDSTIHVDSMRCTADIINDYMDDEEEIKEMRVGFLESSATVPMVIGNEIVEHDGSNPSGELTTAIVASIVQLIYIIVGLKRCAERRGVQPDPYRFAAEMEPSTTGDDSLVALSKYFGFADPVLFAEVLSANMTITNSRKESAADIKTSFMDVCYLSRSFVKRVGVWYAPLAREDVHEPLYWTRHPDDLDTLVTTARAVLIESFHLGRKYYDDMRQFLSGAHVALRGITAVKSFEDMLAWQISDGDVVSEGTAGNRQYFEECFAVVYRELCEFMGVTPAEVCRLKGDYEMVTESSVGYLVLFGSIVDGLSDEQLLAYIDDGVQTPELTDALAAVPAHMLPALVEAIRRSRRYREASGALFVETEDDLREDIVAAVFSHMGWYETGGPGMLARLGYYKEYRTDVVRNSSLFDIIPFLDYEALFALRDQVQRASVWMRANVPSLDKGGALSVVNSVIDDGESWSWMYLLCVMCVVFKDDSVCLNEVVDMYGFLSTLAREAVDDAVATDTFLDLVTRMNRQQTQSFVAMVRRQAEFDVDAVVHMVTESGVDSAETVMVSEQLAEAPVTSAVEPQVPDMYQGFNPYTLVETPQVLKEYWLEEVEWRIDAPRSQVVTTLEFPRMLLAVAAIYDRIRRYQYFKADVVVTFRPSATKFHYGKLLLSYVPGYTEPADLNASAFDHTDVERNTCLPCVTLSASSNQSVEIRLPYRGPNPFTLTDDFPIMVNGTVMAQVFDPLMSVSASTTSSVWLSIFARFENVEVAGPRGIGGLMVSEAGGGVTPEQRSKSEKGVLVTNTPGRATKAGAISRVMGAVGTGLTTIASFIPGVAPIAAGFGVLNSVIQRAGFDKPTSIEASNFPQITSNRGMALCRGVDNAIPIAVDPVVSMPTEPKSYGADEDEFTLLYIARRPSCVSRIIITSVMAPGDRIMRFPVSPGMPGATGHSNTSWACQFAWFWRGAMNYRFSFTASPHVRVRLRVVWTPDGITVPKEELSEMFSKTFDVVGDTDVDMCIPFLAHTPWLLTRDRHPTETIRDVPINSGWLQIYVVNRLTDYDAEGENSIVMRLWQHAGSDMQFAVPCAPTSYVWWAFKQPVTTEAGDYPMLSDGALTRDDTGIMRDEFNSLRDYGHRYMLIRNIDATGEYSGWQKVFVNTKPDPDTALVSIYDSSKEGFPNGYCYIMNIPVGPYLFMRGSIRYRFVLSAFVSDENGISPAHGKFYVQFTPYDEGTETLDEFDSRGAHGTQIFDITDTEMVVETADWSLNRYHGGLITNPVSTSSIGMINFPKLRFRTSFQAAATRFNLRIYAALGDDFVTSGYTRPLVSTTPVSNSKMVQIYQGRH